MSTEAGPDRPGLRPGVRLALDVGTVRVGVAACDPSGLLATPVTTLPRDRRAPAGDADLPDDLAAVLELVRDREPLEVVVGLPRGLGGQEGQAASAARAYADHIARVIAPVPVRLVDERLTTVSAHRALRAAGRAGRRHRDVVDQVAAVTILQHALDAERSTSAPPGEEVRSQPVRARDDRPKKGAVPG
jgi:putative holliday junction resolvase